MKLTGKDWRNRPTLVNLGLCLWFGDGCWIGPQHLVSSVQCHEHWVTRLYTPSGPGLSLDPCAPALCIRRSGDCKSHICPLFHQKKSTSEIPWPKDLLDRRSGAEWFRQILGRNINRNGSAYRSWCLVIASSLALLGHWALQFHLSSSLFILSSNLNLFLSSLSMTYLSGLPLYQA